MTIDSLVMVVRSIDEWHCRERLGNTRLRSAAGGVHSMIPGSYMRVSDEDLRHTLLITFGIDPADIKRPEDLLVEEQDVARCRQLWHEGLFGG